VERNQPIYDPTRAPFSQQHSAPKPQKTIQTEDDWLVRRKQHNIAIEIELNDVRKLSGTVGTLRTYSFVLTTSDGKEILVPRHAVALMRTANGEKQ